MINASGATQDFRGIPWTLSARCLTVGLQQDWIQTVTETELTAKRASLSLFVESIILQPKLWTCDSFLFVRFFKLPRLPQQLKCLSLNTYRTRNWSVWLLSRSSRPCRNTASTTWTDSSASWPGARCWIRWKTCTALEFCRTAGWPDPSRQSTGGASVETRSPGWADRNAAARPSTSCSTWSISWSPFAPGGWETKRFGKDPR